jgi:hypothetical protein
VPPSLAGVVIVIIGRRLPEICVMTKRTEPLGLYHASRRRVCQGDLDSSGPSPVAVPARVRLTIKGGKQYQGTARPSSRRVWRRSS